MLIDEKSINNTFELSAEILFGTYITGWRWMEDEDNPPVAGDTYSNVLVFNDEFDILVHIQVLFRPDNTWMLMVNCEPDVHQPVVLNGNIGTNKDTLLEDIYAKFIKTSMVRMGGLSSIIHRLARAMYIHREDIKMEKRMATWPITNTDLGCSNVVGWHLDEEREEPPVLDSYYGDIIVRNYAYKKKYRIKVMLKDDGKWMLNVILVNHPANTIVTSGLIGGNVESLIESIRGRITEIDSDILNELSGIIIRLATIIYRRKSGIPRVVKYDSDIPRCGDLIPDPQHYSISRILDWIGRKLRLACIHNSYINVSQSDICMVLDSEFIGHGEHKIHVHDQKLIDALTSLGYIVEILDNLNAVDCIRISGWKTQKVIKGGKEDV
jgi:hypothetical protein|nr:MAG TPA: hypothetical protein [Caudoviricetes sp.]